MKRLATQKRYFEQWGAEQDKCLILSWKTLKISYEWILECLLLGSQINMKVIFEIV
jgi:hypothetical protein